MPERYFSPTPQEPISGALAAALQRVLDYASKSGSYQKGRVDNPVLPIAADALGLPALQRTLERLSYGDRLTEGSGETFRLKNDTTDAAMAALPMAQALRKFATPAIEAMPSALAGSRTAQRGAITVGGNPDLYPYHGTSAAKLLETLPTRDPAKAGIAELSGPSIGISKGGVDTSFAHGQGGGVLLIPRVGAYDPAAYPATLFNRDAYTPRFQSAKAPTIKDKAAVLEEAGGDFELGGSYYAGNPGSVLPDFARRRNRERLSPQLPRDLRVREFTGNSTGNWAHDEAIKGSPAFRSFKQFENSPLGAALLMDKRYPDLAEGAIEHWQGQGALDKIFGQGFTDFLNKPQTKWDPAVSGDELATQFAHYFPSGAAKKGMTFDQFLSISAPSLRQTVLDWGSTPEHLNQAAREYRGLLKQTPSNYAEIKVAGPTQLSPENWAGAVMLHRPRQMQYTEQGSPLRMMGGLSRQQRELDTLLPFPVVPHDTSQPNEVLTRLVDALQKQAGPARTQPLGTPYLRFLRNPPD